MITKLRVTALLVAILSLLPLASAIPAHAGIGTVMTVRIDPAGSMVGEALGRTGVSANGWGGHREYVTGQTWYGDYGQKWEMKVVAVDASGRWVVTFRNLYYSYACLDHSKDTSTDSRVWLYDCNGAENQRWTLDKVGSVPGADVFKILSNYAMYDPNYSGYPCLWSVSWAQTVLTEECDFSTTFAIYRLA
jgi:hypothetical protein